MITPKQLDEWRIVPRLLIALYGCFALYVGLWFMEIQEPSAPQAAFVSVIWGASSAWFGFYVKSGGQNE